MEDDLDEEYLRNSFETWWEQESEDYCLLDNKEVYFMFWSNGAFKQHWKDYEL